MLSNGMATSTGYARRGRLPALAVDVATRRRELRKQSLLVSVMSMVFGFHSVKSDDAVIKNKALAILTGYSGYPALDCLQPNFCQCSQSITCTTYAKCEGLQRPQGYN